MVMNWYTTPVSIRARPEGRALPVGSLVTLKGLAEVSIRARPEGRALHAMFRALKRAFGVFQSALGPKAERYASGRVDADRGAGVSIRARPEGRALRPGANEGSGPVSAFQSALGPKAERYRSERGPSRRRPKFQSALGPKAERYFPLIEVGRGVYPVSIRARPEGRALLPHTPQEPHIRGRFQSALGPKAERYTCTVNPTLESWRFQSALGPKAERYRLASRDPRTPAGRFQSALGPKAERYG